jgi:hypothetical protein
MQSAISTTQFIFWIWKIEIFKNGLFVIFGNAWNHIFKINYSQSSLNIFWEQIIIQAKLF